jgi:hypothetical protein
MSKLRVVQFNTGKYAVQKYSLFGCHGFLDKTSNYIWDREDHVKLYSTFDTFWEAEDLMKKKSPKKQTLKIERIFA